MAPEALELIEYGAEPSVLLFADSDAAFGRARRGADRAGCRILAAESVDCALRRLDRQSHVDLVLVEVDGDSPSLVPLLDRLESDAREHRHRSVVSGPEQLIDAIAARTPHRDVLHLCRPNDIERVAAVALASLRRLPQLRDRSEDTHNVLHQLSDEVARIAGMLAALAQEEAGDAPEDAGGKDGPPLDAGTIRAIIRARRLRDRYFKGGIFADPAWDMMLDLMAARLERHRVAVSSLCIAAAVPPTTALRWIKTLTERGVFVRCADPGDGRRVYIELSDEAARALASYIHAAQRTSPIGI
jgi:hypothetical protein